MTAGGSRTLTFLFTDIEGSTRLWERHGDAMRGALAQHDALLREGVELCGGAVVKTTGDGMLAVFDEPAVAIAAAIGAQRALASAVWGDTGALRVRMAVHCGPVTERDGDYFGTTLNRAARIMGLGHGGQVLVSEAVAVLVREASLADGAKLRDLGEHRLRDLSQVERVFQVDAPGLVAEFRPLRSVDAFSTNLPPQLTSFVGREDEIETLTALVRGNRLVTLTGVGGVGKTRLALRVAAEVLPDAADGVWVCELAAADAEEAVLEIVTRALGVVPRPGMSPLDSIVDHLRERECLVVLDNCEHLLDIAADLTDALLRGCERVRVLATSREGLGVDGEQLRPVRSLPVPPVSTAAAVLSTDSTTLFAERAAAVAPSFRVDDANAAAVVEICRRLDGIPLAIELAAARVASLQPAEIAGLLDERFRLLAGSRRRTVERHQTLRATVDWSYSLLQEMEGTVFDRLGVFVGSFDTSAAHAVVADTDVGRFDVVDALGELVAKSMVMAEPAPDGTTRYQLLETLRQYALERLEHAGEVELYRRRHAEHYATVTSELGPSLYGPGEASVRARLDRETDNLRAAVDWSIDAGEPWLVRALIDPIAREAAWNRGSEVGGWAERALSLMGDDRAPWGSVRFAVALKAFFTDADWVGTLRIVDSLLDEPDLPVALRADAFTVRANSLAMLGDLDGCIAAFEEAFAWMSADPAIDPEDHAAISLVGNFAIFLAWAGDVARARVVAEDCLRCAEARGAPSTLALAHFAVGGAYVDDDPARAAASFEEARGFSIFGVSNIVGERSLQMLALLAWREGDAAATARYVERALNEALAMGDYSSCGSAFTLAIPVLAAGERWQAVLAMETALTDGTIPLAGFYADDVAEARGSAVAAARSALGDGAAKAGNASRSRDTLVRDVILELETLAAG